jgi:magnesium-transporting ATPase (P-type)
VLTGDKRETALNTAKAAGLIPDKANVMTIDSIDYEEVKVSIDKAFEVSKTS